jgi:hypothetical protein
MKNEKGSILTKNEIDDLCKKFEGILKNTVINSVKGDYYAINGYI